MKAKILKIERIDQSFNVEVEYMDTNFNQKRVFNFNNADSVTQDQIETEVERVGQAYKNSLSNEEELKEMVGSEITI